MRFAVIFAQGNAEGVMVFSAEDMEAAKTFVSDLLNRYGHSKVSDPLRYSGNPTDLYNMFPPKRKGVEES